MSTTLSHVTCPHFFATAPIVPVQRCIRALFWWLELFLRSGVQLFRLQFTNLARGYQYLVCVQGAPRDEVRHEHPSFWTLSAMGCVAPAAAWYSAATFVISGRTGAVKILKFALLEMLPNIDDMGIEVQSLPDCFWDKWEHESALRALPLITVEFPFDLGALVFPSRITAKWMLIRRPPRCLDVWLQCADIIAPVPRWSCSTQFGDVGGAMVTIMMKATAGAQRKRDDVEAKRLNSLARHLFLWHAFKRQCAWCRVFHRHSLRWTCKGCRRVKYCSRRCQKKHWRDEHREQCSLRTPKRWPKRRLMRVPW